MSFGAIGQRETVSDRVPSQETDNSDERKLGVCESLPAPPE